MRAVFDPKDLTFRLYYDSTVEREQMFTSFNRKIQGWRFKSKGKGGWKGDVQFISNLDKIPAGLWGQMKDVCKKYGYPIKVAGFNEFLRNEISYAHVAAHCEEMVRIRNSKLAEKDHIKLRPYQPKAVYTALKYRLCMLDLSTSAGKTLVMFLYASYVHKYLDQSWQVLTIEPDPEYVIQTYAEVNTFSMLAEAGLNIGMVSGSSSLDDISEYNFVVGNFQTLKNRDAAFFSKVKYILVDEGHRAKAKTIKDITKLCVHAKDHVGLSGTVLDDKSADHYEILAATGPTVIRVTKRDLMDQGFATKIKIRIYVLNYLSDEQRREIAFAKAADIRTEIAQYDYEMSIIRHNPLRMAWMAKLIAALPKTSLTFFIDKQNEYGKRLYQAVRQISSSNKELFYIDGDTKTAMRDLYKKRMEESENAGLLATYATYGTGKSIKNLHYLIGAEPMKAETIIGQVIGRGMRLHADKEEFWWIDVVDDFSWEGTMHEEKVFFENILYRQMKDRIKLYKKDKFEYEVIKVNITSKNDKLF